MIVRITPEIAQILYDALVKDPEIDDHPACEIQAIVGNLQLLANYKYDYQSQSEAQDHLVLVVDPEPEPTVKE